jgi:hypothetical protein
VTRDELLALLFGRVPDPFASLEQGERHTHVDLDRMQPDDLERERTRVVIWLALTQDNEQRAWLSERRARIVALQARRYDGR